MPNVQTAPNTTNHSNATNSTVDRLANKITILDLGNKYSETIELHKKASAEVERAKNLEKSHREKLEELISKRRLCQNASNWDSYTRLICETLLLIHANEEDVKKALELEESTKDNMETAEAEWKLEATNITNHSNATNSTEGQLADKKTIQNLGNKYSETIPLHKKVSAEVKRANRRKKQHKSEWIWSPEDYPLPEYPVQRFPKKIPQGPARILNYTVEDLDKEFSKKDSPGQCSMQPRIIF
ncbi:hypothetical protein B9Z55_028215 [Caenorhabditis nigoni]|uniref:Uncharacterized protein n=1 Tax=Caenorhabditis nigoni TaxID=1611254 RepID=A0A2G5SCC7_9PELO|nr:hypothetical protein B9Z55_028215 [Caenorhabditis nigoni]